MKHRRRLRSLLPAASVVALFVALAIWQFYSFVTFTNSAGIADLEGGKLHFFLAVGFAFIGCLSAFLAFSYFLRFDRNDELHITAPPAPRTVL